MTKRKKSDQGTTMQDSNTQSTTQTKEVKMNTFDLAQLVKFSTDENGKLTGFVHVGTFGEGRPVVSIDDYGAFKGGYKGLLEMSVGLWETMEEDLHLHILLANRYQVGFRKSVGYVKAGYRGEFLPILQHTIPTMGFNELDLVGGELVARMNAIPTIYSEDEGDYSRHQRNAFNKHAIMNLFMRGVNVAFRYNLYNEKQVTRVLQLKALTELAPADRKVAMELERVSQRAYFAEQKVQKISEKEDFTGFYVQAEEVVVHGTGARIPAADLIGKKWQRYMQAMPVNAPILITEQNFAVQLEVIRRNALNVELVK